LGSRTLFLVVVALALGIGALTAQTPAPQPTPAPTPVYRFIFTPTPPPDGATQRGAGAPEIREIDISDQAIAVPGELRVRVVTNAEVVSVVAGTMGRDIQIPQQAPGQFGFTSELSDVPAYLHNRSFDVDFVATSRDGRTATVTLQLSLK
jgi:hypothetical protein